ncbi:MFS transporter [Palleronia marisminoris]|uniref:MFS transporter n=1 Tax=Palleronia marisminoris TaxID=315423 RepID=UPI0023EA6D74|nr:MFS transporter [Palleronia marisminoris]
MLIVALGLCAPFLVNTLSFLSILAALWLWAGEPARQGRLPPETLVAAMGAGLRYASQSPPLQRTLLRAVAFFLFASCFWAMLPLIVRGVLGGGAGLYGLLLGAVGAGAVAGAFVLPTLRRRLGADRMVAAGTLAMSSTLLLFSLAPGNMLAVAAAALGGFAWIAVLSSFHVAAQMALPDWVRARGLSLFLMVFAGTMAVGSLVWGQVATATGVPVALAIAAIGAIVAIPLTLRAALEMGELPDFSPAHHWAEPAWALPREAGDRRIMVQIGYRVETAQQSGFTACMLDLAAARRRNGGFGWSLMQDASDLERFVETWTEASWTQHLRHHARVTVAEKALQDRIRSHLAAGTAPEIYHLVTPEPGAIPIPSGKETKT